MASRRSARIQATELSPGFLGVLALWLPSHEQWLLIAAAALFTAWFGYWIVRDKCRR